MDNREKTWEKISKKDMSPKDIKKAKAKLLEDELHAINKSECQSGVAKLADLYGKR